MYLSIYVLKPVWLQKLTAGMHNPVTACAGN